MPPQPPDQTGVLIPQRLVPVDPAVLVDPLNRARNAGFAGFDRARPPAAARPLPEKREAQKVERPRSLSATLSLRRAGIAAR